MIKELRPPCHEAIQLLHKATFLKDGYFMCFGKFFNQLRNLDFIDNEYNVTYYGKQFVKHCITEGHIDEQRIETNPRKMEPNSGFTRQSKKTTG